MCERRRKNKSRSIAIRRNLVSVYPNQQYPRESLGTAGASLEARLTPTCDLRGKTCMH